ncbi:TetR/AcrR family transcriptional regulator; helix-turn-helix transcriptional regulator [Yinghuangia sp. ASG 101]|uniref:TetR/AcrR family transcriptional regulator n=1 Tax=Yinghuangia sp. ASG 101 TaxID=2896848 RepID=UPI001E5E798F|nr:TetR/AcrR family transcriptional regulator [Yinghuangia sp. ASG 101]UGQ12871.1 TetR/AcrR family transcriptional regulator; helix-turn-helix transcriptional regulator [Yinghuangia sp. ASG 101]
MGTTTGRTRRTQRERSGATTAELLAAARDLFASEGYAATSLDAVCERAGVSKGALYHHFRNKEALFHAVYAAEEATIAEAVAAAYLAVADKDRWDAVFAGCEAYLVMCLDPGVQRITLLDAPGALGVEAVDEVSALCVKQMYVGVKRAIEAGRIAPRPVEPLARLLFGGLSEAAKAIGRAPDPLRAQHEALDELRRLFDAFVVSGPTGEE